MCYFQSTNILEYLFGKYASAQRADALKIKERINKLAQIRRKVAVDLAWFQEIKLRRILRLHLHFCQKGCNADEVAFVPGMKKVKEKK